MSAKKRKRVVVDKAYFELIERKSMLLNRFFEEPLNNDLFKEWARIDKVWMKLPVIEEPTPYVEPK